MIIVGITGTIGSGKGTVVEYLTSHYHFAHFSVRTYLTSILTEQGIAPNRDTFTTLANHLRESHQSPSYIVEQLYNLAQASAQPSIIESIRTVGEIEKLRELGSFYLLAVDADREQRYHRIVGRKSETDQVSYTKFVEDELREMNSIDPNKQNIGACMNMADYTIQNDGSIEHLHAQIDEFILKNKIKTNV